jgi:DNA polymerase-3 subunit beta
MGVGGAMYCIIGKEEFVSNLAGVVNVLMSKTTYPVLQNVFLEATDKNLIIKATDLDSYVEKRLPIQGKIKPGKVILPGKKLLDAVRELSSENLTLSLKENKVTLEAEGSTSIFAALDPAEYPEVPEIPKGNKIEFPQSILEDCFKYTGFAASKEEARPAMCGVYLKITKSDTRMVATDGYRLAFVKMNGKFDNNLDAIIAPKVFNLFPEEENKISIYADSAKIAFVFEKTTIISRLIEGPYPDYQRIIPDKSSYQMQVKTDNFIGALRRAAVFAHPVGRLIALNLSAKKNSIYAETADLGQSTQEFSAKFKGDEIKIGFNVNYLLEVLHAINTDEIVMEFLNPLAAGVIKPATKSEDLEKLYLLMPIRLE